MNLKNIYLVGVFIALLCSNYSFSQQITANATGYAGHIYHLNNYNMGIGISAPEKPLHIYRTDLNYPTIRLHHKHYNGDIAADVHERWDIESQSNKLNFKYGYNTQNTINHITFQGGTSSDYARIGIGSPNPSADLDIINNASSGASINIQSNYDASIKLIADNDNNTGGEADNPYILFSQDQAGIRGLIGLVGTGGYGPLGSTFSGTTSNYLFLGAHKGIHFCTTGITGSTGGRVRMSISTLGYIAMGGAWSGSYRLKIYGDAYASGGIWQDSDQRFKKNIKTITGALSKIQSLRGTSYEFDREKFAAHNFSEGNHYGFIAQELQKVFPEMVKKDDSTGYFAVNYDAMIPVLVEATKEQQAIIENQNAQIESLYKLIETKLDKDEIMLESNIASLSQNNPNPFNEQTIIEYYIPEESVSSSLMVFDMNGSLIKTYNISEKGKASTIISGNELKEGMYLYSLIVDGKEVSSKRMILTN